MSTTNDIRVRIAAMAAHITGVVRTYAEGPRQVPLADLPCIIVNVPSPATYEYVVGDSTYMVRRTYPLIVLVQSAALGAENEYESSTETLLDRVAAYFFARPGLEESGASLVYNSYPTGDASLQIITWGGGEFLGTTINLLVEDVKSISYAD